MIEPGNGILLISDPFLKDPNFMRSVVLLCEHNEQSSFGLVLNRKLEQTLDFFIHDLKDIALPVFYGGPVQLDTLHFLHRLPEAIPGGELLPGDIYWGGDFRMVIKGLIAGTLDTDNIRFYLGYSGWSAGQLQEEIEQKSWLTVPGNQKLVFGSDCDSLWKDALKEMGGAYEQLIHYPIDPQLN
jgi:putative transcriptional regulator